MRSEAPTWGPTTGSAVRSQVSQTEGGGDPTTPNGSVASSRSPARPSHTSTSRTCWTNCSSVREILDVDTAAVLLLDEVTNDLVATAAEAASRTTSVSAQRVPLGQGFAGRIAAEGAPVVIEDVDHLDVLDPRLRKRGVQTLVGVPLAVAGRAIGVLHVGSLTPRQFEPDDVEFVQLVADRVALAIQARRSNVERAAAAALQRSPIPDRRP